MNKQEVIKVVSKELRFPNDTVQHIVDTFLNKVTETLQRGEPVNLMNFGKFVIKHKAERKGCNFATKEFMTIPAKEVITFKPSKGVC